MAEPAPASRPPLAIRRVPFPATWRIPLLAILALLFSTLLLAACGDEPKPPAAILEIRAGTVQVKALPGAAFLPAANGQELVQGNEVRAGSTSKIAIIFFDGSVTLLEDGAELRIDRLQGSAASGFSSVELFQAGGRTIHRVQKLVDADSAYILRTSSSIALVRGTGFIVEDDPVTGTKLKSFEGRVGLAGESGVEVAVVAGDPAPPIPDPLTPEEADSVDEVETIIEENEVELPPAKDPDISTPIPGPTATLPPLPPPPPEPVAQPVAAVPAADQSASAEAVDEGAPATDASVAAVATPTPEPPAAAPAPAPTSTPAPTPTPEPDEDDDQVSQSASETASTPTRAPTAVPAPTSTPAAASTPTPEPTPDPADESITEDNPGPGDCATEEECQASGGGGDGVVGPGGCTSEAECNAYCEDPANYDECGIEPPPDDEPPPDGDGDHPPSDDPNHPPDDDDGGDEDGP